MGRNDVKKKTRLLILSVGLAAALVSAGIGIIWVSMATGKALATEDGNSDARSVAAAQGEPKTIRYSLIAEETTLEIAPGVRVSAWTFNSTIPGPTLRATEGDRVIINFTNLTPLPHTVHLHGDHDEKNDGVFQKVNQGESYIYDFIAEPAGALMYHCHVMPVSQHVRMGLYGAFIVDPKVPLEPAREYVIVTGEYDTKNQMTELPQYVLFNGYADQYWNNPLIARTDELVRIYYVNLGASPAFGFHIHGTVFDAYPSGILENEPLRVQTWEVGSGNAAIFEVRWPWEGRYPIHLHGSPEEKGTMAYVNVTSASENAVDGVDIARNKSIDMMPWQDELTRKLQKADPQAAPSVNSSAGGDHHGGQGANYSTTSNMQHSNMGEERTSIVIPAHSGTKTSGMTFNPQVAVVKPGETVTWINHDAVPHTVDSNDGSISSGYIAKDQSFQYTFEEAGLYDYYCALHPWMVGSIRVAEDSTNSSAA
ncbi:MAG TPA: multicopper oxidase domain-containing protein [Nitrososphaera sp.]|nr:multicopper oxidase domain-containing protein [Nitrososphaera sp.]